MRVIAGKFKSLKLNSFEGDSVRPTTDKVKEAVFSKIQFELKDSYFLDLFGGTGAIGIEAISRGAVCYVCDKDKKSCSLIKDNYKKIKIEPNLLNFDYSDAIYYFKKNNISFDICYVDPPYLKGIGEDAINKIINSGIVKNNGLIIYEHLRDIPYTNDLNLELISTKNYGTISIEFLRVIKNV